MALVRPGPVMRPSTLSRICITPAMQAMASSAVAKAPNSGSQAAASRALLAAAWLPLFGALATALLAIACMAGVMQILLNVEGRITGPGRTNAITLASNAWSTTVPGGPAISAWLTYRVQRTWGCLLYTSPSPRDS